MLPICHDKLSPTHVAYFSAFQCGIMPTFRTQLEHRWTTYAWSTLRIRCFHSKLRTMTYVMLELLILKYHSTLLKNNVHVNLELCARKVWEYDPSYTKKRPKIYRILSSPHSWKIWPHHHFLHKMMGARPTLVEVRAVLLEHNHHKWCGRGRRWGAKTLTSISKINGARESLLSCVLWLTGPRGLMGARISRWKKKSFDLKDFGTIIYLGFYVLTCEDHT